MLTKVASASAKDVDIAVKAAKLGLGLVSVFYGNDAAVFENGRLRNYARVTTHIQP